MRRIKGILNRNLFPVYEDFRLPDNTFQLKINSFGIPVSGNHNFLLIPRRTAVFVSTGKNTEIGTRSFKTIMPLICSSGQVNLMAKLFTLPVVFFSFIQRIELKAP